MPMSATPSWAITQPSMYSTIECTIDCGCTITCTWSGARSKSQRASMISSPLFIRVAESIVILAPIFHVGCWSASSTVIAAKRLRRPLAERAAGGRQQDRGGRRPGCGRPGTGRSRCARSRPAAARRRAPGRPPSSGCRPSRASPCWRAPRCGLPRWRPSSARARRRPRAPRRRCRRRRRAPARPARRRPASSSGRGAGSSRASRSRGVGVEQGDRARRVLAAEVGDPLDVGAARGEPGHRELVGEARDELERAQPDGAGGAEDRDAFHRAPRHQRRSSRTPGS